MVASDNERSRQGVSTGLKTPPVSTAGSMSAAYGIGSVEVVYDGFDSGTRFHRINVSLGSLFI